MRRLREADMIHSRTGCCMLCCRWKGYGARVSWKCWGGGPATGESVVHDLLLLLGTCNEGGEVCVSDCRFAIANGKEQTASDESEGGCCVVVNECIQHGVLIVYCVDLISRTVGWVVVLRDERERERGKIRRCASFRNVPPDLATRQLVLALINWGVYDAQG